MILGGPALYLLGESVFRWRLTGETRTGRVANAALLLPLLPLGGQIRAVLLSLIVASLLPALAVWERRARCHESRDGYRGATTATAVATSRASAEKS